MVVVRRSDAGKGTLERLDNPPDLGKLRGRIAREETCVYYLIRIFSSVSEVVRRALI